MIPMCVRARSLRPNVLPPVFVSTHKKMRRGVSQVDASEISRRAANTNRRSAGLQAEDMNLEGNNKQKHLLLEILHYAPPNYISIT